MSKGSLAQRLLASALAGILSAVVIAIVGTLLDGTQWENLSGILWYAIFFVAPFTLLGAFAVVLPIFTLVVERFPSMVTAVAVMTLSAFVGWAMLVPFGVGSILIGSFCGALTAIIWIIINQILSIRTSYA